MIKKCPFCGNEPGPAEPYSYGWAVGCNTCEFAGPMGHTKEQAERAWNERSKEENTND